MRREQRPPIRPYKWESEFKHSGLSCCVVMTREAWSRCGYVRVPYGHPDWGKPYEKVDVNVHGGLTFARAEWMGGFFTILWLRLVRFFIGVDGLPGWWFGFDCCHWNDALFDPEAIPDLIEDLESRVTIATLQKARAENPYRSFMALELREHYWLQSEVEAEVRDLAEQLALMGMVKL